eukprot:6191355-Pleurochrysis_carterae.AAC.1
MSIAQKNERKVVSRKDTRRVWLLSISGRSCRCWLRQTPKESTFAACKNTLNPKTTKKSHPKMHGGVMTPKI